ncbi:pyrroline-5-carboxylate reductase [Streptococcus catagoni]|uniref:pyrroline-5-carboxylate reductase n=1 Tax=Streptococcus catagoni TaxID=2654874 RepID=UPI0014090CA8|nr:pyrroline-5-carboxylate reductase [Streptococcus catagoni]
MKIGFIGVGKMASAIIKGLKETQHEIIISGSSLDRSKEIAEDLGLAYAQSHEDLIAQVDFIILGIKPQAFESVLSPLDFKQPIMSMAAGLTLDKISQIVGYNLPLFRIMPNMNANILQSTTALTSNGLVDHALFLTVKEMIDSFGSTFEMEEEDFDTFTALAGSSPAYIYHFIEAMTKAGLKHGIPKDLALEIVTKTVQASAQQIIDEGSKPHDLIDTICSPGGTTIAGLMELESTGFTHSVSSAIDKTIEKAKNL